jgi:hypothetical protein
MEPQSGHDCGVIALQRAQMRLRVGIKEDVVDSKFDQLGKYADSRLLFARMILSEDELEDDLVMESGSPSKLEGLGTVQYPLQSADLVMILML